MDKNKNFWRGKNVLITGCLGFVASWLAMELIRRKARVIGVTNDYEPRSPLVIEGYDDKICLVNGSITDYSCMERIFNQYEVEVCFHLAAQTVEGICLRSPLLPFDANIKGTWVVLEAARNCRALQGIVIASSDKAYGEQEDLPYWEGQSLLGRSPYDVSKVCTELLGQSYFHTFELPVGITRCANIYGGGDFHWSRVIPGTIRSLLLNERPVIRSDGTPVRDYLYVEDAVNAYLTLAQAVAEGRVKEEGAFNFSAETPLTVVDLVKLIISVSGKEHLKPLVKGKDNPPAEIARQMLSCKKARKQIKWEAKHTLKEGLKKTLDWYRKRAKAYL